MSDQIGSTVRYIDDTYSNCTLLAIQGPEGTRTEGRWSFRAILPSLDVSGGTTERSSFDNPEEAICAAQNEMIIALKRTIIRLGGEAALSDNTDLDLPQIIGAI